MDRVVPCKHMGWIINQGYWWCNLQKDNKECHIKCDCKNCSDYEQCDAGMATYTESVKNIRE